MPWPRVLTLSPSGWRDGAQRHAPLQEEVRHHAAVQAHLSQASHAPHAGHQTPLVCTHWATGLCDNWPLAPASSLAGTRAPATSSGPLGPVTLSHPTGVVQPLVSTHLQLPLASVSLWDHFAAHQNSPSSHPTRKGLHPACLLQPVRASRWSWYCTQSRLQEHILFF